MAIAVFAVSGLTALLCTLLLMRAYWKNRIRLLFWASLCFAALALENVVLIVNELTPADLTVPRLIVPLVGLMTLLYGMLWEADSR